jgi:hypothetical protein
VRQHIVVENSYRRYHQLMVTLISTRAICVDWINDVTLILILIAAAGFGVIAFQLGALRLLLVELIGNQHKIIEQQKGLSSQLEPLTNEAYMRARLTDWQRKEDADFERKYPSASSSE